MIDTVADMAKRGHGQGSLYVRADVAGRESWYGHWRANGRQVKRRIGPKRVEGTREGMTVVQAEKALRDLIAATDVPRRAGERLGVEDVSRRYRLAAERKGRKKSTVQDIESHTRVHLAPFFDGKAMDAILPADVTDLVLVLEDKDLRAKTIRNIVGTLSALFNFAKLPKNQWAAVNPCEGVDLPTADGDAEIRFLKRAEVDALVEHARPGPFQALDRALWLTAAMTGLRQGELIALRWVDVDWPAARIRVRQNYVRGEFGTPKSKRSTRSVPMADDVAGELDRLYQASRFQDDGDLVFAHPKTGEPLLKGNVTRRLRASLKAAGLPSHRFHDLRHTFGTTMAASGTVPMRTLQEWMGHKDLKTTLIYADYSQGSDEAGMIEAAFARGSNRGSNLRASEGIETA